ncbi:LPS assembly lipoprotein LptE [Kangiella sp.]|uniref:LPS-assembly lipoprotein LptE n=1 Tax=Kangiella sp. TaxID=1920245 RepID=UPI0019AAEC10|nr:LPS assembly lipoprotein LptE [Kangiella sp.]MBD3654141.1 hypothetical protein [Kangiella sp.]
MKQLSLLLLLTMVIIGLSACGFQLRGQGAELSNTKVWLISQDMNADFERRLKQRLAYQGAQLVDEPELSELQLAIVNYGVERRTVARDSLGRAAELEMIFTLEYQMLTPAMVSEQQPETQRMTSRREFAYERNLESGQEREQQRLIADMQEEVIGRLLLQIAGTVSR